MKNDGLNRVILMSPENGQKMLQLGERIEGDLENYISKHAERKKADLISHANMTLYNMAQSRGISLWNLCFEVMPYWEV